MENANSPEYLEKIKNSLVENLRRTAHAPSVQMQDVPRHALGAMSDEEEAELDDMDEDDNKDVRMTQRQWEQRIEPDNEYEESDHEDLDRANGVHRNGSARPLFNDYRNSDVEVDSGAVTPANGADSVIISKEADDVVMEDVEDKVEEPEAERRASPADQKEPEEIETAGIDKQEEALKESQEAAKSDKADTDTDSATAIADKSGPDDKAEVSKETDEVMQDTDDKKKSPAAEAEKTSNAVPEAKTASEPEKVDGDGDVDMEKPAAAVPAKEGIVDVKKEQPTENTDATPAASSTEKTDDPKGNVGL